METKKMKERANSTPKQGKKLSQNIQMKCLVNTRQDIPKIIIGKQITECKGRRARCWFFVLKESRHEKEKETCEMKKKIRTFHKEILMERPKCHLDKRSSNNRDSHPN